MSKYSLTFADNADFYLYLSIPTRSVLSIHSIMVYVFSMATGPNSTPKKRSRDPETKRQVVLNASLTEFAKHGFAGARADRIALVAGVSVGTVFKLFGDKRGLANAVYADCLAKVQSRIGPAVVSDLPARTAFDQMWEAYVEFLFREPNVLIFFEYQPNISFLDPENRLGLHKLRTGLARWIEKHKAAGVLKDASAELLRAIAIGSLMRLLRESVEGNTTLEKTELDELNELVWAAISRPKRSTRQSLK